MSLLAFEDFVPAHDCACAGCTQRRRSALRSLPASESHGCRRTFVAAAAVGVVVSGSGLAFADTPRESSVVAEGVAIRGDTPQGVPGPLRGAGPQTAPDDSRSTPKPITRGQIIERAKRWVGAKVPYSMSGYWSDGYRRDCSGFVSMAWNLGSNQWTGSLAQYGERIKKSDLQPGDMLLFHNPGNPGAGSHVTIFGGWADAGKTRYVAYEQTRPNTLKRTTPYAYWHNSERYVAYRPKHLASAGGGDESSDSFPGAGSFGPGSDNKYVTKLGKMLIARGAGKYYTAGPGPRWSTADRRATQAFQRAQGWTGSAADGVPGPVTWDYLMTGKGSDIGSAPGGDTGSSGTGSSFPGAGKFRPGQSNAYVEMLGRQLVKKGFGKHFSQGPGPRWTESDRRNVEAFQRAQGWRGSAADGYPGPETWRRVFA
ncbi:peptidoglycan-binding protein [Streptomyces sp. TRM66268-LWL]|uniref:Peptidoglycan-binding protein n=1 Tax=Streptomyces polyasparticus TaxID=2767826 RepID=A0ABR7SZ00_9ACTN|nr:peptidoglycan-binding protein [Streptomyces polyasparticus]MBC9719593.1 peptidoglycan-binding protein [Streptomyces polyasparticus]